ncbi:MAG TPA: hypothetical protein VL200_04860 [Lacunisphaera sp.]|jgi:hypothetical protein|nr:hypothetical protein [Lacunisphaera sp.]
MKTPFLPKFTLLAAALLLAGLARAEVPVVTAPDHPVLRARDTGLLGHTYSSFNYTFGDLDRTAADMHTLGFEYNRAVEPGLDTFAAASEAWSTRFSGGGRLRELAVGFGARYFQEYQGLKPYGELGFGWDWDRGPGGFDDNGFAWQAAVGVEVPVTAGVTVAPYVRYENVSSVPDGDHWHYGAAANFWVNDRMAIQGGIERQDHHSWNYRLGLNFSY